MGVYKPKNSPYYVWQCMIAGNRYNGTTKKKTLREARDYYLKQRTRILKEIEEGPVRRKQRMTLDAAAQSFYELHASFRSDAQDIDLYLERLVIGLGPYTYIDEITDHSLLELQSKLRGQKTRYNKLPSNRTVNATVPDTARLLWKFCKEVLKCEVGDEPIWKKLKLYTKEERTRELTADEEKRLFKHLRADYHPLMRFAFLSGLRLSNLMRLSWANIDHENKLITVKVKSRKEEGKTVIVPITAPMQAILQSCLDHHPVFVFTWQCTRTSKTRKRGERYPYKKSTFRRPFKKAMELAGIDNFRFHDYRHTAATRVLRASKNLKAVQLMLGHEDITTTAKYAHVLTEDVRDAMNAVDYQTITEVGETALADNSISHSKERKNR